ncbi:MAG: hypothetical protein P4M08_15945 [Oligoflexia bacterium]|nr:hypothetical protein [Oligoflexia bacterium]
MKINPLTSGVPYLRLVQTKDDAHSREDAEQRRQNKGDHSEEKQEPRSDTEMSQAVDKALETFSADPQTRASGLAAAAEGSGPGLRVVLKDAQGKVVRQFTGEEFLRLREAAAQDHRARGKILDQKY